MSAQIISKLEFSKKRLSTVHAKLLAADQSGNLDPLLHDFLEIHKNLAELHEQTKQSKIALDALEGTVLNRYRLKRAELWSFEGKRKETSVSLWDSRIDQAKGEISALRWVMELLAQGKNEELKL